MNFPTATFVRSGGDFSLPYIIMKEFPLKYTFQLSRKEHLLLAIQASDMYQFGGTYGITAARTVIFSGRTGLGDRHWRYSVVCTTTCAFVREEVVTVNENICQIIVQAELKQTVAGGCDCPSVFFVMIHNKTTRFCTIPEFAIVVCTAISTMLESCSDCK